MSVITETKINQLKWTSNDLELLTDDNIRYEIIDGELYMIRAPHWSHQNTEGKIYLALQNWSNQTKLGKAIINPGIIFSYDNNVIPDVI